MSTGTNRPRPRLWCRDQGGGEVDLVMGWDPDRTQSPPPHQNDLPDGNLDFVFAKLAPGERAVLELLRRGKSPSDIAAFLSLRSRQHAEKEIRTAIAAARYYVRWLPLMRRLLRSRLITRRQREFIRWYFVDRMPVGRSYTRLAAGLGIGKEAAGNVVLKLPTSLRGECLRDYFLMLTDRKRFVVDRRTVASSDFRAWRARFVRAALARVGEEVSEAVLVSVVEAGIGGAILRGGSCLSGVARHLNEVTRPRRGAPEPGDLAFYGEGRRRALWCAVVVDVGHGVINVVAFEPGEVVRLTPHSVPRGFLWFRRAD